ncbi:hypothetical protein K466DRAFT_350591 [Polyporus arcularius HHB13444]|uniref:Uncharacterized protein n=1 Tax=Polyporus arcularius HHB13444 TaxID=1314778 RepID=A0A5C3PNU4_9APHY|nr:hypothetical protein K466DRAFT_350591 [Polyporus arcularius HHB13444]
MSSMSSSLSVVLPWPRLSSDTPVWPEKSRVEIIHREVRAKRDNQRLNAMAGLERTGYSGSFVRLCGGLRGARKSASLIGGDRRTRTQHRLTDSSVPRTELFPRVPGSPGMYPRNLQQNPPKSDEGPIR